MRKAKKIEKNWNSEFSKSQMLFKMRYLISNNGADGVENLQKNIEKYGSNRKYIDSGSGVSEQEEEYEEESAPGLEHIQDLEYNQIRYKLARQA
jgi:hypothetical protein